MAYKYKRPKWQEDFYGGIRWKNCRKAFATYKGGLCEECYKRGIITPGTVVHHKVHLNAHNVTDETIAYNFDNLMLLCSDCHRAVHQADRERLNFRRCDAETGKMQPYSGKRRWAVTKNGELIVPPSKN